MLQVLNELCKAPVRGPEPWSLEVSCFFLNQKGVTMKSCKDLHLTISSDCLLNNPLCLDLV